MIPGVGKISKNGPFGNRARGFAYVSAFKSFSLSEGGYTHMICKVCHREFIPKKPNQEYCNGICRRRMELYRKRWDMHLAYIELAELAATNQNNPQWVRDMRAEWAKNARKNLKPRP